MRGGFSNLRASAAELRRARAEAQTALNALSRNPADQQLQRKAIDAHGRFMKLAALFGVG